MILLKGLKHGQEGSICEMKVIGIIEEEAVIKKDPQTPQVMGSESKVAARSRRAAKGPGIQH